MTEDSVKDESDKGLIESSSELFSKFGYVVFFGVHVNCMCFQFSSGLDVSLILHGFPTMDDSELLPFEGYTVGMINITVSPDTVDGFKLLHSAMRYLQCGCE